MRENVFIHHWAPKIEVQYQALCGEEEVDD